MSKKIRPRSPASRKGVITNIRMVTEIVTSVRPKSPDQNSLMSNRNPALYRSSGSLLTKYASEELPTEQNYSRGQGRPKQNYEKCQFKRPLATTHRPPLIATKRIRDPTRTAN